MNLVQAKKIIQVFEDAHRNPNIVPTQIDVERYCAAYGYWNGVRGKEVMALIVTMEQTAERIHLDQHGYATTSPFVSWRECPDDVCLAILGTVAEFKQSISK